MPALLERYIDLYTAMLTQMEEPVTTAIEQAKQRVVQELEGKECRNSLTIKINKRFLELKDKAASCNNVATFQNIKVEADALKVRLLNEINAEEAKIIADKEKSKASPIKEGLVTETIVSYNEPKVRTKKTVSIKSINIETMWRIETESDVDHYIEGLKKKLKQSINEDVILNIKF